MYDMNGDGFSLVLLVEYLVYLELLMIDSSRSLALSYEVNP